MLSLSGAAVMVMGMPDQIQYDLPILVEIGLPNTYAKLIPPLHIRHLVQPRFIDLSIRLFAEWYLEIRDSMFTLARIQDHEVLHPPGPVRPM